MKLVFENIDELKTLRNLLSIPFSDEVDEIKAETVELIEDATSIIKNLLDGSHKNNGNILKEFIFPYKENFKVIDAYTEKINIGISLLKDKLSIKQFRLDRDYPIIEEKLSVLENQLIPELERRQESKKLRNIFIITMLVASHIFFYFWIFFV